MLIRGLDCCRSPGGQCRAQIPNFILHVARVFDGLGDFLADEPAIATPQIVKLFFYGRLCYPHSRSQPLVQISWRSVVR